MFELHYPFYFYYICEKLKVLNAPLLHSLNNHSDMPFKNTFSSDSTFFVCDAVKGKGAF